MIKKIQIKKKLKNLLTTVQLTKINNSNGLNLLDSHNFNNRINSKIKGLSKKLFNNKKYRVFKIKTYKVMIIKLLLKIMIPLKT